MSISEARVTKIEQLVIDFLPEQLDQADARRQESKDARWINLNRVHYLDPTSTPRTYESATRTTRPSHTSIDSIGIVAIIERPCEPSSSSPPSGTETENKETTPYILLQKQFRPSVGKTCIETPAGLIDESDATPLAAAIRELKEETGYTGYPTTYPFQSPTSASDRHPSTTNPTLSKGDDFTQTPTLYNDPGITNTNTVMVHLTIDASLPANQNPQPTLDQGEFLENFEVKLADLWGVCIELEREGFAIDARVGGLAEGIEVARRWGLSGCGGS